VTFQADIRFDSLTEAFAYVLGQYALQSKEITWAETASGLAYPRKLPRYLLRGECGEFATTTDGARRLQVASEMEGFPLSPADVTRLGKLIFDLVDRCLCRVPYNLDRDAAVAQLQHYGLPTRFIDFTARPGYAFAFATAGVSSTGRVAVMPSAPSQSVRIVDLMTHRWAERAQRQGAFCILPTDELADLKSQEARSHLDIKWYEFPILPSDRDFFREIHKEFLEAQDDPSAGFLRFHITEYVEAFGKLSPTLTEWLLNRVPIAPRCYQVDAIDEIGVVVRHRAAESLPTFDEQAEKEHTRRYWSSAYDGDSRERIKNFAWPAPGSIVADPRTYHP
jgi:hypothetical protein